MSFFLYFSFETVDGTRRTEVGFLKSIGDTKVIVVRGSYSYRGSDGKIYHVMYSADENGYMVSEGPALGLAPAPPPPLVGISPALVHSLVG